MNHRNTKRKGELEPVLALILHSPSSLYGIIGVSPLLDILEAHQKYDDIQEEKNLILVSIPYSCLLAGSRSQSLLDVKEVN